MIFFRDEGPQVEDYDKKKDEIIQSIPFSYYRAFPYIRSIIFNQFKTNIIQKKQPNPLLKIDTNNNL